MFGDWLEAGYMPSSLSQTEFKIESTKKANTLGTHKAQSRHKAGSGHTVEFFAGKQMIASGVF